MTRRSPYPDPNVEALRCDHGTGCAKDDEFWHLCDECNDIVCEHHGTEFQVDVSHTYTPELQTRWLCQNCNRDDHRSPDYDTL